MNRTLVRLLQYFNLDGEIDDFAKIHEAIERDLIFKGTNLWILIFAIVVACVGLNMNSTAVVIGAMLISPLMGPINGVGYSVATYNFPLLRKSLMNYGFAVGAGLFASTIYFAISPVSTAHSELLARTSPTIYDVLIALFGGLAGIVAITSKQKGNVIAGVAIATALMPPLCTAGYGIATGQFKFFFGALYLFTINSVFIAISSVIVSQILKFPITTVDEARKSKVNKWITAVILVTVLPSIYFGYVLVQREQFTENAARYVNNVSVFEGNYLLKHEIDPGVHTITLTYGGRSFTEAQEQRIRNIAQDFKLSNAVVLIKQGLSFDALNKSLSQSESLTAEVQRLTMQLDDMRFKQDSLLRKPLMGETLLEEIRALYPQIRSCSYAETALFSETADSSVATTIVIFGTSSEPMQDTVKANIRDWLNARLKTKRVRIYYE